MENYAAVNDIRKVVFENQHLYVVEIIRQHQDKQPERFIEISTYNTISGLLEAAQFIQQIQTELVNDGTTHNGLGFLQNGGYSFVPNPTSCTIYRKQDHVQTNACWMSSFFETANPYVRLILIRFTPTIKATEQATTCLFWAAWKHRELAQL